MKVGLLVDEAGIEGIKLKMDRQPWAHAAYHRLRSTTDVVVDHQDQDFERAGDDVTKDLTRTGKVEDLVLDDCQKRVTAAVDWAYEGVTYRRTVALSGSSVEDTFELSADGEHTYDYVLHGRGVVELAGLGAIRERLPQDTGGYEYFVNTAHARTDAPWCVVFKDGGWPDGRFVPTGKRLTVSFEAHKGTEVYTGYAPSRLKGVYRPFVLARRGSAETTFRVTLTPDRA